VTVSAPPSGNVARQLFGLIDLIKNVEDRERALIEWNNAKTEAEEAQGKLSEMLEEARANASETLAEANKQAADIRAGAEADAQKILSDAEEELETRRAAAARREGEVEAAATSVLARERAVTERSEQLDQRAAQLGEAEEALSIRKAWYDSKIEAVEALTGAKPPE
jgi:hypothetical protein